MGSGHGGPCKPNIHTFGKLSKGFEWRHLKKLIWTETTGCKSKGVSRRADGEYCSGPDER